MIATTRLHGESAKAYSAFKGYVALGDQRTLPAVAAKCKKSASLVGRWSARWKWQKRLRALAVEEHELDRDAMAEAKLEAAREIELQQAEVRENSWQAYEEAIVVARLILRQPIPANESPTAAARLLVVADMLGRMALGMPVTRAELTGKNGKPLIPAGSPIINVTIQREARKQFGEPPPGRRRCKILNDPEAA